MEFVFATHNKHKTREIQSLMPSVIKLLTLDDIGCYDAIVEDADTIEGNALLKATYIYEKYGCNVFADDTGLEVEALGGAPGVYSARYAGEPKSDIANINKLLAELENVEHRKARFKTVIALIINGKKHSFEGIVNGNIVRLPRGTNGFGYDSVFCPEGFETTFAEMTPEAKNNISHRAIALEKLLTFVRTL